MGTAAGLAAGALDEQGVPDLSPLFANRGRAFASALISSNDSLHGAALALLSEVRCPLAPLAPSLALIAVAPSPVPRRRSSVCTVRLLPSL